MLGESSTPNPEPADVTESTAPSPLTESAQSRGAKKRSETVRRRIEERRTDKLDQLRAQVADGTLIIRQMTVAQREEASHDASQARARSDARHRQI